MKSEHESTAQSPGFLLWHVTLRWQRAMAAFKPSGVTHVQFVLLASLWWLAAVEDGPALVAHLQALAADRSADGA